MSNQSAGVILLISAPSGAGKTTVCQNLLKSCDSLSRAITCTTREAREGETHGQDYYFLTPEEFERKVGEGAFLEYAEVYGNRYGTLKSEVVRILNEGKNVLLNIDVQGAQLLRQRAESDAQIKRALVTVFLTPPEWAELERRLRSRATDSEETIATRLGEASRELKACADFDYLVLSESREEDLRRMEVILEAESMRLLRSELPRDLTEKAQSVGK